MAWTTRGYYRSVRVDGRPRNIYLGRGPEAEAASLDVMEGTAHRTGERQRLQTEERQFAEVLEILDEFCRATDALLRAALAEAGYHRHDRGRWRRRHGRHES